MLREWEATVNTHTPLDPHVPKVLDRASISPNPSSILSYLKVLYLMSPKTFCWSNAFRISIVLVLASH